MPREVVPPATAASACSICTSFPEGEKVVREKLEVSLLSRKGVNGISRVGSP